MSSQPESDAAISEELFLASVEGDYEDEKSWEAVRALRLRGGDEVFRLATMYIRSEEPIRRARALDVLAQLGTPSPTQARIHFDESVALALGSLNDESPLVIHSAGSALAHLGGELAISALIGLSEHDDPGVRLAVAFGLARSGRSDAISALIGLTSDEDDEVRNWATFGLGNAGAEAGPPARSGTLDSFEIRNALRKRLTDSFRDVRDEATWGLALRRDPAGLRLLLDRLDSTDWVAGDEMAAAEILDVGYQTPVEVLRTGLRKLVSDQ